VDISVPFEEENVLMLKYLPGVEETSFYLYGGYLWTDEFIITVTLRCENTFFLSRREGRGIESVTSTQDTSYKVGHALIRSFELLLALFFSKIKYGLKNPKHRNQKPTFLSRHALSVSPLGRGV
jgi:hypothetical protein